MEIISSKMRFRLIIKYGHSYITKDQSSKFIFVDARFLKAESAYIRFYALKQLQNWASLPLTGHWDYYYYALLWKYTVSSR